MTPLSQPRPTQVELMEKLCKKLRFKYHPNLFANPMLTSFFSNLEALVYEEEVGESEDVTKPRTDDHDEKILEFVDAITEEFGEVIFDILFRSIHPSIHFNYATSWYFRIHRFQQLLPVNVRAMLMEADVQRHQRRT